MSRRLRTPVRGGLSPRESLPRGSCAVTTVERPS